MRYSSIAVLLLSLLVTIIFFKKDDLIEARGSRGGGSRSSSGSYRSSSSRYSRSSIYSDRRRTGVCDSRRRTDYYDSRRRITDYSRRRSSWDSDYDYSRRRSSYSADVDDNKPLKQSVWIPLVVIFAGIPVLASLIVFCWIIKTCCERQPEFSSHSVSHRTVSRQNRSTNLSARNDRNQTRPQFSIRIQPTPSTTRLSENSRAQEDNNRTVETSLNTLVPGTASSRSTITRNVPGESTITGDHGSVDPNRLTPTAEVPSFTNSTRTDESIKTVPPTYSSLNRTSTSIPDSTSNNLPPPSYNDLFNSDK